ncbi:MAG: hypothetical protein H7Y59_19425 [Anaerolineales bacterium]|nr:hypothetical protein [Anaerolineales bacterium]
MSTITKGTSVGKVLLILCMLGLLFIVLPFSSIGALAYFDLVYVVPLILSITLLCISAVLVIRKKSINLYSIVIFIAGLLFLASSVTEFGFIRFTQNLITDNYTEIFLVERLATHIAQGFSLIALGIFVFLLGYVKNKNQLNVSKIEIPFFLFCCGVIFVVWGAYTVLDGFYNF